MLETVDSNVSENQNTITPYNEALNDTKVVSETDYNSNLSEMLNCTDASMNKLVTCSYSSDENSKAVPVNEENTHDFHCDTKSKIRKRQLKHNTHSNPGKSSKSTKKANAKRNRSC